MKYLKRTEVNLLEILTNLIIKVLKNYKIVVLCRNISSLFFLIYFKLFLTEAKNSKINL